MSNINVVIASRVLTGLGTGVLSIARAFIAEKTETKDRTRYVAYSTAVTFVGFAVTPGDTRGISFLCSPELQVQQLSCHGTSPSIWHT